MTRTRLLLGTALAAALLATPALAQFPFITNVDVTAGGAAPTITDSANLRIVTLNAPRTYLDHGQGFFLSSGTTLRFDFANPGPGGVALLRADSGFTILGTVEGRLGPGPGDTLGGNLWFFSRGGILLAEGGRVAAGGILLSNALPELLTTPAGRQQLLADDALVIEANLGPLLTTGTRILSGASIEASEGYLAIISQNVEQGSGTDIRAARGTVLVGAANSYTIRLARNTSNDFDLVEFEVPAGGGTDEGAAPIDLAGSVRGGNVWLSLVGSVDLTSALIRATGTIVASAATLEQGQIVLSAGSGIVANAPGPPQDAASTRIRAELADLAADGDIRIRQDEGELSTAVAGGDIRIETREIVPAGTTALGSLEAGGSIFVNVGGDVTASAPVTAGGDIIVRGAGAVTLGTLSAGDDIVAVAGGLLLAGDTGTTIESRNEGPDVTRDGDDTDPSDDFAPVRSIYLESTSDRVLLQGLLTGFIEGAVRSALAPDINVDTGPNPIFLGGGLSVTTADLGTTTRITLTDSVSGPGPTIRFSEIVSGPLRLRALGEVSIGGLSAVGFAGVEAAGGVIVGDARVVADQVNAGSLGIASDAGSISLGGADVDGDLILVARQGSVRTLIGANIRFGDDLYAISGRGVFGQGITFNPGTSIASKPGFPDVAGNEILDNGDPSVLLPDFGRDFPDNGRVAELLALAQFGQFPPGVGGDVRFEGRIETIDRLELQSDSASIRVLAPDSRLAELSASAALDVELSAEAIASPFFTAGRDALLTLSGVDPVTILASAAGRDLSITAGGPLSLESTSVGRDLTMTAPEIRLGPLPGSPRNVTLSTLIGPVSGGIFAGNISATGTIRLVSLAGTSVLGNLAAGADIIVETGFITLGNLTAAGSILMEVNGLAANLLTAGGAIGIVSQAGDMILAAAEAGGNVTMFGEGAARIEAGGVTSTGGDIELWAAEVEADVLRAPDGSIRVDGRAGPARLGTDGGVAAGLDIEIRAVGLDLLELDAGRDLLLEARGPEGDILGEGFAAVRDLTLIAGRDADLVRATAGRNLSVTAARDARLAESSAGQDIAVLAPEGAAVLDGLDAGRDLSARGGALSLNAVAAGRDIDLETTREDLLLASEIAAVGNLRLVSAAALTAEGPLSAGGAVTLRARDDAPTGVIAVATVTAGGDLDARAWTVRGARLTAGGSARVVGAGPGSIEADEIVADDDVDLTSPSIRVGFVRSTGLGPDVDGDGFNVRLAGGLGEFIAIEAPTDIRARMTGQLAIADAIAGRDADLEAGSIRIQPRQAGLVAGRDARLVAATTLEAGRVSAGDDVTMEAGGAATLGTVEARGDGEDAEGDGANIRLVSAGADALALAAPGDIIVDATTGPAVLGQDGGVAAGRDLLVAGTTLDLVDTGSGRDLRLTATAGDITGPGFTAVRDLTLSASGDVRARSATAGRDVEIGAGDMLDVEQISAGRDVGLDAGRVFNTLLDAGRDMTATVSGSFEGDLLHAGDDVRITANAIRVQRLLRSTGAGEDSEGDGRNLVLVGPSGVSVGTGPDGFLGAPDDVTIIASLGRFQMPAGGRVSAGRDLAIVARDSTAGFLDAGRDLSVDLAIGGTMTRRLIEAGRDIILRSGGDLGIDAIEAARNATVDVAGELRAGPAQAGLDLEIRAGRISPAQFAPFSSRAGRDVSIVSASSVDGGGPLLAGRDATVSANGTVRFTVMEAGDDLEIAAGGGDILAAATRATGLGQDTEGDGSNIRISGASAVLGDVSAAEDLIATLTGTLGAQALQTGRDAIVTAQGLVIDLSPAIGRDLVISANGGLFQASQPLAAGRDVIVTGAGDIRLAALTAGRDLDLAADGELEILDSASAGRDARLLGGSVTGPLGFPFRIAAGRDIRIESTAGDVSVRATAGDDVSVRAAGTLVLAATATGEGEDAEGDGSRILAEAGGAAFLQASSAAGDFDLVAGGRVQAFAAPTAGGSLRITGAEVQLPLGATAGTDAEIRATGGLLFTAGLVRAEQDVRLVGADGDRVDVGGTGLSAGRDIVIAGDEIVASSGVLLAAGRDARLTGTGFIGTRQAVIEAGRDVDIATDGGINFGRLVAGDDILVASAASGVRGEEVLTTGLGPDDEGDGSTVRVSGGLVEIAGGESAGDMLLSGRDAVFAGFRNGVAVAPGLTAGQDLVVRSSSVQLNLAGIGRNLDAEAATGGIDVAGSISAPGSVRLQALIFVDVAGGISAGADVDVRSLASIVRIDGPVTAGDDLRLAAGPPGVQAGALTTTGLGPDGEGDGAVLDVRGGMITLGPVSAALDFVAESPGAVAVESIQTARDARVTAASLALGATGGIGRDLLVTATGAGFTALGPLAAGRDIRVTGAGDILLAAVTAGRDLDLAADGALETGTITAPRSLAARAARMTIGGATVGGNAALETTAGELALGPSVTTGGDLLLRAPELPGGIIRIDRIAAGGAVDARAFSILSAPGGGFVSAAGPVRMVGTGAQSIDLEEVISDDDVDLASPSIRVGRVRSTGVGPDRAGDGFNIRLDGGTGTFGTLEAPTDILARFTAALAADSVRAGRDAVLASGAGTLALGTVEVQGVATLVGGALALRDTLSAAELRLVSTGPMRFGGAPGGTGFVFSAEEFARTTAPGGISASSGAVPRATTPQGPASAAFEQAFGVGGNSDLVVDSFTFDPARVALFGFYAGAAASIRVIGDITPTETGGRIILGANPVEGLTPGAVLVSGSLGAGELFLQDCYVALFPLENIAITALGDVIFGNAAFQQAVAAANPAAIDVQAGTPGLPPSPADDRLWAVTETLSITAPGRIVSQNTSSVPGSYAGLVIANRQSPPLVPTVLTVTGGSVVDLSGVLVNGAGRAFFGPTAARSGAIAATNPSARFNSCAISGTGSCLPPLADPGLGFRPDQFLPPDPVPAEPFRLSGEILFLLGDTSGISVTAEDGALFIRRDEEEERPDRAPGTR